MYEFIITSEKERKLLEDVNKYYLLKKSQNVRVSDNSNGKVKRHILGRFRFFLSTFRHDPQYYKKESYWAKDYSYEIEVKDFNYSELQSNICICNFQDSLKHLNSIRGKNPETTFQLLYLLASKYPDELFTFLSDIQDKHKIPSIGMINHISLQPVDVEGLNKFLTFLKSKGKTNLLLISSKEKIAREDIKSNYVITRSHKSEKELYNLLYYKQVNWNIYKKLMEIHQQLNDIAFDLREEERWQEYIEERDTPGFDEDIGPIGEMSDEEFQTYIDNLNKTEEDLGTFF